LGIFGLYYICGTKKGGTMEKKPLEINFTNFWGFQKSDNSLLDEFF